MPHAQPAPSAAVRIRLALAWAAVAWERLWIGLWPVATLLAFAAALALTDVLPSLPALVHLLGLAILAVVTGALAWRGLRAFSWPRRSEARARLEAASPVSHRPLTTAEDTLAAGTSPLQVALWRRHQALARAALKRLRSPWPAPDIARRDGFAIRALAILVLAVALIGTGRDAGHRLARALIPAFGEGTVPVTVKLWITPPAYTGQSPIYIEVPGAAAPRALDVPAGAKALVVVSGTRRKTTLALINARQPAKVVPLADMNAATDDGAKETASRRAELELTRSERLEVRQGSRVLAGWDINWIPDELPSIAFAAPPRDTGRGRLRIDYVAKDDHGLQSVTGTITRPESNGKIELSLSLPPFGPKETAHTSIHDVGAHPWAGLKASLMLTATDQAGQTAKTEAIEIVLPERSFTHPVAKEIAQWRKELVADPEKSAAPARDAFADLMEHPAAFNGDRVVYLALASAKYRLVYQRPKAALAGMPELLWQTAVRIEDGNLGEAEQRLEAAEHALKEAMERDAPAEEISRLVDEMRRALADYTKALAERMPDKNMQLGGVDKQGKVVSPDDIAAAMEQLRKLSQMGAQDAAKQMLANLQNMLQTLRNAAAGNMGDSPDMKQAEQMMQELRDLTENQSQLLNESFEQVRQDAMRAQRQNGNQKGDQNGAQKAAERQQKLRQQLGELMGKMSSMTGKTPGAMGEADGAMRNAEQALQAGAWKPSADAQGMALSKLESGMQEASQQMMQAMAKKGMSGLVQMPGGQRRLDGLGPRGGAEDGEQIDVPNGPDTEGMSQRVRAILEEIRRRASDRTRPAAEQEYLRRLMKEF